MYRSLDSVGKALYRAFLPSFKNNRFADDEERDTAPTTNSARVPRGWSRGSARRHRRQVSNVQAARQAPTAPWGWPGNRRNERSSESRAKRLVEAIRLRDGVEPETPSQAANEGESRVGWPYRDEAFEFAGRQYKVVHASGPVGSKNLGGKARPWGW